LRWTRTSAFTLITRLLLAAALTVALAGCALSGPRLPPVDRGAIESKVTTYFRKTANIPRAARIQLTGLQASAVPGWQEGRIEVTVDGQSQTIDFIATNDGRYLLQGEMIDLSIDPVQTTLSKLTTQGQPILGDPNAPVTIVVFSDFQCPFCAKAERSVERKLLGSYQGKAKLVFKNLPLHQIHSWADSAAIAGECAYRENNKVFWAVHSAFFEQQAQINNRNLDDIAVRAVKQAGGDTRRFSECLRKRSTEDAVSADVAEANALGVKSTPTFFINGRRVTGAQPIEGFTAIVDEELTSN